jgi:CRISPR-associated protein Cas2
LARSDAVDGSHQRSRAVSDSKWWLVCYDVRDPGRLRRAAHILEGTGQRMQFSVFRCWLNPTQMQRLRWELTQVLEPVDDVLMIPLCSHCVEGMETTHSAQNVPDWPEAPESFRVV